MIKIREYKKYVIYLIQNRVLSCIKNFSVNRILLSVIMTKLRFVESWDLPKTLTGESILATEKPKNRITVLLLVLLAWNSLFLEDYLFDFTITRLMTMTTIIRVQPKDWNFFFNDSLLKNENKLNYQEINELRKHFGGFSKVKITMQNQSESTNVFLTKKELESPLCV